VFYFLSLFLAAVARAFIDRLLHAFLFFSPLDCEAMLDADLLNP